MALATGVKPPKSRIDALREIAEADVAAHVRKQAAALLANATTPEDVVQAMLAPGSLNLNEEALLRLQINITAEIEGLDLYHKGRFEKAVAEVAGILGADVDAGDAATLVQTASDRLTASLADLPEKARDRFLQVGMAASVSESGFGEFGVADVEELIEKTVSANASVGQSIAGNAVNSYVGQANEWRSSYVGIDSYQWQTREDGKVRESHAANNGQTFKWASPPATGAPGADYNCFPGWVELSAAGLEASIAYRYSGQIVEIVMADGVVLSVTPDHPVLTESGWRRARDVEEGVKLFQHDRRNAAMPLDVPYPDLNDGYARAEKLHVLLGGLDVGDRTVRRSVDLYGNPASRDEDVDVVDVPSLLLDDFQALGRQVFGDIRFPLSHAGQVAFPLLGTGDQAGDLPAGSPHALVGVSSESLAFAEARSAHSDRHCFTGSPRLETEIIETRDDHVSVDSEVAGDLQDRLLCRVGFADGGMVPFPVFEMSAVAQVRLRDYDGIVYDGQTASGLILANGIVVSNCRCIAAPEISDELAQQLAKGAEDFAQASEPEPGRTPRSTGRQGRRTDDRPEDRLPHEHAARATQAGDQVNRRIIQPFSRERSQLYEHRLRPRAADDQPEPGKRVNRLRTYDSPLIRAALTSLKIRQDGENENIVRIGGYAYRYDDIYDAGWFTESIAPGAVESTDDVRLLIGHDRQGLALARSPATMTLAEDDVGLAFEASLDLRSPDAQRLYYSVERGDTDGISIGFYPLEEEVKRDPDGEEPTHYTITLLRLLELSGVIWPAYESSSVEPRQLHNPANDGSLELARARARLLLTLP